jgi:hypothetical protein
MSRWDDSDAYSHLEAPSMTIASRSLALAGGAALLVGVLGAGIAVGAGASAGSAATISMAAPGAAAASAATDPTADAVDAALAAFDQAGTTGPAGLAAPGATAQPATRLGHRLRQFARWKQLVHATVTVNRPGAGIQAFNLDHGTITALTAGSLTVAEAGGSTVTLTTDTTTRVRKDRAKATLADLRSGDEVVAVSKVGSTATTRALLVVVPPAASTSTTP